MRRPNGGPRLASIRREVDGLDLHARISTGPVPPGRLPVVLVHGLGMSSRYLMPLAGLLAPDFRVCAPDLPGFGSSAKPARVLDVPELARALAGFLDAMEIERAAFVGNSLGCEILVELALRQPARVARVVLQGPTPDPKDRSAPRMVALFAVTGLFERWSLGWVALGDYLRAGPRRYFGTFQAMVAHRIEPKLREIRAPALVVRGTRDFIVPRRSVERYARLLPQGRLEVIQGAAHGMCYSHPLAFRDAIVPFLLADRPVDGLSRA